MFLLFSYFKGELQGSTDKTLHPKVLLWVDLAIYAFYIRNISNEISTGLFRINRHLKSIR